jgi:hypothetical protein
MDFSTYFKFSLVYQIFDLVVLGLLYYGGRRATTWWANRKIKSKMAEPGYLLPGYLGGPNECPQPGCQLGPRHKMPCWDGTPSTDYEKRCGGKWVWVPDEQA